jgi:hypothetical protein
MRVTLRIGVVASLILWPVLAAAQEFPFERTLGAGVSVLEVSTERGRIEIAAGQTDQVLVTGVVTVRAGWNVPVDAIEIARRVAADPPIERDGDTLRLRRPADGAERRAVTVSYRVHVPPGTDVHTVSGSGTTSVRGTTGVVAVRTQSAAIELGELAGTTTVESGSGAITGENLTGELAVTTRSGSFEGLGLGSSVHIRTQSGSIDAAMSSNGDVDVESGSSAIRLRGVRGALTANTRSGRIAVQGAPSSTWQITTGSGAVVLELPWANGFTIDAASRSASVDVEGADVEGEVERRAIRGAVNGGGPTVTVRTGSGSIRAEVGAR